MAEISDRIRKLLKEKEMSQKELAGRLNMTEAAVSRYVNGERKPRADAVARMARELNVTIEYLMGEEENPDDFEEIKYLVARNAVNFTDAQKLELAQAILSGGKK